jgi:uncharacterized membrane protein (UPF0127 family)
MGWLSTERPVTTCRNADATALSSTFPIDIAFVADDGRVIDLRHALGPWHVAIEPRAACVVELAAGTLERTHTNVGDVLVGRPMAED